MSRRKKIAFAALLTPILLIVAAILFLDHIAKKAVEIGGEQAMGVPTAVDGVSLRPLLGEGSISGLQISNPAGFETPYFMRLARGDASLKVASVLSDEVVVRTIELDGVRAYLEKTREGANYEVILANMGKGEERGAGGQEGKKFLVERITVRNIDVRADVAIAGEKLTSVDLHIDRIDIENVGSGTDSGVVMSKLMGTIVKAVLTAIVQQGAKVLPQIMVNGLGAGLKGLGKVGVKVVGNVTAKVGGKAINLLGGAATDAIKGIGGIFGGGDKDK